MPDERYALLVNLGKKITDYSVDRSLLNDGECLCYAQSIYDLLQLDFSTYMVCDNLPLVPMTS